eukprot:scaffold59910_cov22-Tisochrysis_lutea.AAC.1
MHTHTYIHPPTQTGHGGHRRKRVCWCSGLRRQRWECTEATQQQQGQQAGTRGAVCLSLWAGKQGWGCAVVTQ